MPIVTALLGVAVGAATVWGLMPSHVNGGTRSESPAGAAVSPSGGSAAGNSGESGKAPGLGNPTPGQGGPGASGNGSTNSGPSGKAPGKKTPASGGPSTVGGDTETATNPQPRSSFQLPTTPPTGAYDPRKQAGKYDPGKFKLPSVPPYRYP